MEEPGMFRGHQQKGCSQAVPITGASPPLPPLPGTQQAEGCSKVVDLGALAAQFLPVRFWFLIPSPHC